FSAAALAVALLPEAAPVRRAGGAIALAQCARLAGRGCPRAGALGSVVFLLLVAEPTLARSWSFALTVSASGALVLAATQPARAWRRLLLVAAPGLATWPLLVVLTGRLAPWGVVVTWPLLPFLAPTLACGWIAVLAPESGPAWLVSAAGGLSRALAALLIVSIETVARWPGSGLLARPVGPVWVGVCEIGLAGLLLARERRWRVGFAALVTASSLLPIFPRGTARADPTSASLVTIDVGQGQAVLAVAGRHAVLIDAGDDRVQSAREAVLTELQRRGIRQLAALVVTHADRDHSGGARLVLAATPPNWIGVPASVLRHPDARVWLDEAVARGVAVRRLARGERFSAGSIRGLVLNPLSGDDQSGNDTSLALWLRAGDLSVWIAGDNGHAVEGRLLGEGRLPIVDLLVAGHHGSDTSSSGAFLDALRPSRALISCGIDNRFGHPDPAVIGRLRARNIRTWTTDASRTMSICFDEAGRLRQSQPGIEGSARN
ncbi:MAG: ComEC/Rec2 family competence protein, partial [Acidobacteriota bacterium]